MMNTIIFGFREARGDGVARLARSVELLDEGMFRGPAIYSR